VKCERCSGVLSMSATSGGTTWWRCTVCQHIQAAGAAPPPPPAPALAPGANRARYASGGQPAYQGQTTAAELPDSSTVSCKSFDTLTPGADPQFPLPSTNSRLHEGVSITPGQTAGCGMCGAGDVQYVLETDVGLDAVTFADGDVVRAAFCSVDCLAQKLGLARLK
jgi:hypothetical protein